MKDYIENRVLEFARLMIKGKYTIRDIAKLSNVGKSTIHKDLTERLLDIDIKLWENVRTILDFNLEERASRGGKATSLKYKEENK